MIDALFSGKPVTLTKMLAAREERAARQEAMRGRNPGCALISLTLNIPGPVKRFPLAEAAFNEAYKQAAAAGKAMDSEKIIADTGCEGLLAFCLDAMALKRFTVAVEDRTSLGRLLDMDVLRSDGSKVSREEAGLPPRRCFLCGKPAAVCARSRAHGLEALETYVRETLWRWHCESGAARIGESALRALLYEVAVTPKPGLVDRRNSGAHRDMDFYTFMDSAAALTPYFQDCARLGISEAEGRAEALFSRLQPLGLIAEGRMREATGGVNTHKGAIFSLGLLCAAAGRLYGRGEQVRAESVCREAGEMAQISLKALEKGEAPGSNGARVFHEHGVLGARGEAAAGFPTVLSTALPVLQKNAKKGYDRAGALALLALLTDAADTNVIHRAGPEALKQLHSSARALLLGEATPSDIENLDEELIAKNVSPGGSADLLSAAFFLYFVCSP